jgi:hypothetical protein
MGPHSVGNNKQPQPFADIAVKEKGAISFSNYHTPSANIVVPTETVLPIP